MQGEREVCKVIGPEQAKRPTEVTPVASKVMPITTEEKKSQERREERSQLTQGEREVDKVIGPKQAKRPTEVVPVATEEEKRIGEENQVEPPRADKMVGLELAELSPRMNQWLEMRLAHIRQTFEEKDVLLYPWGLEAQPKVHSCGWRMEPPDRDVLLFPW